VDESSYHQTKISMKVLIGLNSSCSFTLQVLIVLIILSSVITCGCNSKKKENPSAEPGQLLSGSKALTPMGTALLPMYVRSLFFRHPRERNLVFDITFSWRGGSVEPDLESQAESFIQGVQVPNQ
jgi:hypothetical protein